MSAWPRRFTGLRSRNGDSRSRRASMRPRTSILPRLRCSSTRWGGHLVTAPTTAGPPVHRPALIFVHGSPRIGGSEFALWIQSHPYQPAHAGIGAIDLTVSAMLPNLDDLGFGRQTGNPRLCVMSFLFSYSVTQRSGSRRMFPSTLGV